MVNGRHFEETNFQNIFFKEMLTSLFINGKSEDVEKLLKCPEFWNFVNLILIKHPFIQKRVRTENVFLSFSNILFNKLFLLF